MAKKETTQEESNEQNDVSAPNASILDVARLAQVSIATVSRVLSGKRTKDDDIAKRVRSAAQQLNYTANSAASALRSDVTNTIGLVTRPIDNALISNLLNELDYAVTQRGMRIVIGIGSDNNDQLAHIERMVARKTDGILIIPPLNSAPADLKTYNASVPIVQISGSSSSPTSNWVGVDETAAMALMLTHLAEHNAHNIAFLCEWVDSSDAADMFITFQTRTRMLNLMTQPNWTRFGESTIQRGYADTLELFNTSGMKPDAIICMDDSLAIGALMALRELNIRVPDDVMVSGSGNSVQGAAMEPGLTSMEPPYARIVEEAMRLLDTGPAGKHWLPTHVAFPPVLIRRGSTDTPRIGSSDMSRSDVRYLHQGTQNHIAEDFPGAFQPNGR